MLQCCKTLYAQRLYKNTSFYNSFSRRDFIISIERFVFRSVLPFYQHLFQNPCTCTQSRASLSNLFISLSFSNSFYLCKSPYGKNAVFMQDKLKSESKVANSFEEKPNARIFWNVAFIQPF
jgi:hypothetical protein